MKQKKTKQFTYHSKLSPDRIIAKAKEQAEELEYRYFSQTEKGFVFEIENTSQGQDYCICEVMENKKKGGSTLKVKVVESPWKEKRKFGKKLLDFLLKLLLGILLLPVTIVIGIYRLVLIMDDQPILSRVEKKSVKFILKTLKVQKKRAA